ncbi:MAG: hypothetical protein HQL25_05400 [Candidatus Omnitrophica bacterium]|nr:hypothetical protein [Candidatus Omnitrophota bacterium]
MADQFDPQVMVTALMGYVQEILETKCKAKLSEKAAFLKKNIIEYDSKMRLFGLEKFDGPCYVAAINLYLTKQKLENKDCCGVIVLFLDEEIAELFVRALQPGVSYEDPDVVMDNCGELCNIIAVQFKNEAVNFGYANLFLSAPVKAHNDIMYGVDFPFEEDFYYEISFKVKNRKAVVVSFVMANVANKN